MKDNDDGKSVFGDEPPVHEGGFQGFEGREADEQKSVEADSPVDGFMRFKKSQIVEDTSSEPVEEEYSESEVEVETQATNRAQKRIVQLNSEKKQLKEKETELVRKNEELLALVEQLKKSNELQERTWNKQNEWLGQQEQANRMQQRRQTMLQYGLNPDDVRDAIAYEQMEYKAQLEQQLSAIKQNMEAQQHALQVERFNVALDQSLSRELKDYSVDDDVQAAIRDTAYDIASIRGLTAKEAAAEAVKRYRKTLPKRASKRTAAKVDDASVAITTGKRGKAPSKSFEDMDFDELLRTGNFSL